MADTTSYINTASTPGGDGTTNATTGANRAYASWSEWEAAEDGVAYDPGDIHNLYVTGYEDIGSSSILINGWDSDVKIVIRAQPGEESGARPQNAGLTSTNTARTVLQYLPIDWYDIAIANTNTGRGIQFTSGAFVSGKELTFDGCYLQHNGFGAMQLFTYDGGSINLLNCVFMGTGTNVIDADSLSSGENFTINVVNCGFNRRIIHRQYTTLNYYNSWCLHTDTFLGEGTYTGAVTNVEHSVLAEASAPSITTDSDNTWNNDFTGYFEDTGANDYNPTSSATNLLDAGDTGLTGTTTEDANGETRANPCEVGPFELPSGGTTIDGTLESISLSTFAATVDAGNDTAVDATLESISHSTFGSTVALDVTVGGAQESIVLTAHNAEVLLDTVISGLLEGITLTPNQAEVIANTSIAAGLESISLTEYQATVDANTAISAVLESIALTALQASVSADTEVGAGLESIALTENPATVQLGVQIDAGIEAITITEHKADINFDLSAQAEAITLQTFVAAVSGDTSITAALESIGVQGNQADILTGTTVETSLESMLLYTNSAAVALDIDLPASLQSLVLTSLNAQIGISSDIDATLQSIVVSPNGSTVLFDTGVEVTLEALTLSAFQASLSLPTLTLTLPGLEYTMPSNKIHFSMPKSRLHFNMSKNRLHFNFSDEDK